MVTCESRRPQHRLPDGLDGPESALPFDMHDAAAKVYRDRIAGLIDHCEDCPTPQRCGDDGCGAQRQRDARDAWELDNREMTADERRIALASWGAA